jgi:hypothetical protein
MGHNAYAAMARNQKSAFLDANGSVVDVCGGQPCHTDVYAP